MFEFMFAKKIKTDAVMEIIEKYKDDYYIHVTHKPNGNLEIFIGGKRSKERKVLDKIRAEIDQYLFQNEFGSEYRKEVLQIIDKYKAEGSGEE